MPDADNIADEMRKLEAEMAFVTDLQRDGISRMDAVSRLRARIAAAGWLWGPEDEAVLDAFVAGGTTMTAVVIRVRRARL